MGATMAVIPAYGLLVTCSNWQWVFRIVTSHALPFALAVAWTYSMATAGLDLGAVEFMRTVQGTMQPDVAAFAALFAETWFTAISWLHLLMLDFILAREVALDASVSGVFAVHSIVLCFMCGPVGFLSHKLTRSIYNLLKPKPEVEVAAAVA